MESSHRLLLLNFQKDFQLTENKIPQLTAHRVSSIALQGSLAEFRAKGIDIAGPRLHHTETSKLNLCPDLDPRLKIHLKVLSTPWGRSRGELSNAASRGSIQPLFL